MSTSAALTSADRRAIGIVQDALSRGLAMDISPAVVRILHSLESDVKESAARKREQEQEAGSESVRVVLATLEAMKLDALSPRIARMWLLLASDLETLAGEMTR